MAEPDETDGPDDPVEPTVHGTLHPDTRVEVRTGFDQSWTNGFTVEERTATGYRLRRRSDGRVLPRVFAFADVRRERDNMWWV